MRQDKVDLTGVAVLDPQLSVLPEILPSGLMRMAGIFPSAPMQVRFDLLFAPVDGQWKLFGISVGLISSGPVAPAAEAPPPARPAPSAGKPAPAPKK